MSIGKPKCHLSNASLREVGFIKSLPSYYLLTEFKEVPCCAKCIENVLHFISINVFGEEDETVDIVASLLRRY